MREYGILFTPNNIQLTLDRKKTMTRRVIEKIDKYKNLKSGDRLYIQETWYRCSGGYLYRKDCHKYQYAWKSSMFMPKAAARFWLEVIRDPWIEHIQDISVEDCLKEGINMDSPYANLLIDQANSPYECEAKHREIEIMVFEKLWDSINAKRGYGWNNNPRDRVIEFRLLE